MTHSLEEGATIIVNQRVFRVSALAPVPPRIMVLKVQIDFTEEHVFTEPGWRVANFGSRGTTFYVWSARRLAWFPDKRDPESFTVDEDILFVFGCDDGWLLVCETSVRLFVGTEEVSRFELDEVAVRALLRDSQLTIRDSREEDTTLAIEDSRLRQVF